MPKKSKWNEKISLLKEEKPELSNINWSQILQEDPEVFNSIINGVVRVDKNRKSKLDVQTGNRRLHNFLQDDYSEKEFKDAFTILCGNETIRKTAEKINVAPAHVYNLKKGTAKPSVEVLEATAKAYGRKPEYFVEYRVTTILSTLDSFLTKNPETATAWFTKLSKA